MSATLTADGPGSTMRTHPGHLAQVDRTETEAYVPVCCCGWADPISYGDIGVALAMAAGHMAHPDRMSA